MNQIIDLQDRGALGFREFTLCSNILGCGSCVPLDTPQVPQGAEPKVSYEPVNVFTNRNKGKVRYEQEELLNFRYSRRSPRSSIERSRPNVLTEPYRATTLLLDRDCGNGGER